ncbi:MFS transporter [Tenacibaculum maritimum]|uniref:MFS transporter n=1 Tax=Tenacibaculum maritimum TaxID=107401 RepID=UPI0038764B2F
MNSSKSILPIIILSQFCCTSLWFAGNGIMEDLTTTFNLSKGATADLTASVQFGFILGTLIFAILAISDRFSPSKVFFASAVSASFFNLGMILECNYWTSIISFRFFTGFFLAGIYPVGMKIASDYYQKGLGRSLGFLVGALVLGTAFPHLLKGVTNTISWKLILITTSSLAIFGGSLILLMVPDGPHRKPNQKLNLIAFFKVFEVKKFRTAAFGYFGHMWELYAFWAFIPIMLNTYQSIHAKTISNIPLLSFLIIGVGSIACIFSGYLAELIGTKRTARITLLLSGLCCLISPLMFNVASKNLFILYMFFWGIVVIADSPLFSTLVAQNVPSEIKGTALTIVNCIGFSLTIISLQLIQQMSGLTPPSTTYLILAIGPILGVLYLKK